MTQLSHDFIQKIARCLQEEEIDVYTLLLYSMNSHDLDYFRETDRDKVRGIFKVLIEDTKEHADLLKLITELGLR